MLRSIVDKLQGEFQDRIDLNCLQMACMCPFPQQCIVNTTDSDGSLWKWEVNT